MTPRQLQIARTVDELRSHIAHWRKAGERVGLVPTMGALHAGHLALVRAAQAGCDRVARLNLRQPEAIRAKRGPRVISAARGG